MSLYEPGTKLLEALAGNTTKPTPRTLPDLVAEIREIGERADKLAHQLHKVKADGPLGGFLHRSGTCLRDVRRSLPPWQACHRS
jgi:hypothetical protein